MNFKTFWNSNKSELPKKLVVIRHDIHSYDLDATQAVRKIEHDTIGDGKATYYVMLDMPPESLKTNYATLRLKYLSIISWLKSQGEDVQPHVSPIDMYAYSIKPSPWWLSKSANVLQPLFDKNYEYKIGIYGVNINIKTNGTDVFDLSGINRNLPLILSNYNTSWEKTTGLKVFSYAAHGSATPMNSVLNNARLLDEDLLINCGAYVFDTYNTRIYKVLRYISDTSTNINWREHPDTIKPGKYQLLSHPSYWNDSEIK